MCTLVFDLIYAIRANNGACRHAFGARRTVGSAVTLGTSSGALSRGVVVSVHAAVKGYGRADGRLSVVRVESQIAVGKAA